MADHPVKALLASANEAATLLGLDQTDTRKMVYRELVAAITEAEEWWQGRTNDPDPEDLVYARGCADTVERVRARIKNEFPIECERCTSEMLAWLGRLSGQPPGGQRPKEEGDGASQ